jgi:uncharacterized protein with PhoU and TrkA domain
LTGYRSGAVGPLIASRSLSAEYFEENMTQLRWTTERMDQLERAARDGLRVALARRGTEYVVVAQRVTSIDQHEALVGWLPMTGEELTFRLDEIESFQVIE